MNEKNVVHRCRPFCISGDIFPCFYQRIKRNKNKGDSNLRFI
jgi:hypothetical protein